MVYCASQTVIVQRQPKHIYFRSRSFHVFLLKMGWVWYIVWSHNVIWSLTSATNTAERCGIDIFWHTFLTGDKCSQTLCYCTIQVVLTPSKLLQDGLSTIGSISGICLQDVSNDVSIDDMEYYQQLSSLQVRSVLMIKKNSLGNSNSNLSATFPCLHTAPENHLLSRGSMEVRQCSSSRWWQPFSLR